MRKSSRLLKVSTIILSLTATLELISLSGCVTGDLQYVSREDWVAQHKDSTDPVDMALIKYQQAIETYTSQHPEVVYRSDWGVDYSGELFILTDLGVSGLSGLLKNVEVNSPFVVPVIFAINDICKTDIASLAHFSPEEITEWKKAFNDELNKAKNIVTDVAVTLKNNPSVSEKEIDNRLADSGIFALPYFYDEVVNNSNISLLKFAAKVLPDEKLKEFNIESATQDPAALKKALENSTADLKIIKNLSSK
jgi:hypothetical protein